MFFAAGRRLDLDGHLFHRIDEELISRGTQLATRDAVLHQQRILIDARRDDGVRAGGEFAVAQIDLQRRARFQFLANLLQATLRTGEVAADLSIGRSRSGE